MAKPATRAITPEGRVTFFRHDRLGAEMADDLMRRLRTSARLREFVVACVRWHLPLGFLVHRTPLSLRQIDRYLRQTAPVGGRDHPAHRRRPARDGRPRTPRRPYGATWRSRARSWTSTSPWSTGGRSRRCSPGDEIAEELGRQPGPWLAELIDALREGQVVGVIRTDAQARRFVRSYFG